VFIQVHAWASETTSEDSQQVGINVKFETISGAFQDSHSASTVSESIGNISPKLP